MTCPHQYRSNQLFPILPNDVVEKLSENFTFMIQKKIDKNSSEIRLVTSWATTPESINAFKDCVKRINK